jgi:predicted metal-dependent phosphoesterase TrpH
MSRLPLLKADLHVHSYHSGYTSHLPFFRTRDCYSTPEEIYRRAKSRGMDLVVLTDHDSIDGCLEFLERHPEATDFVIGEEIECLFPGTRLRVHIGAYGIDERIHREVQPLRANVFEAAGYLGQQGVAFALNHIFHFYRGDPGLGRYLDRLLPLFPAVEVRNGTMLSTHNFLSQRIVREYRRRHRRPFARLGGSDAHILRRIGTTYTVAPARDREEFLRAIREGRARAAGLHGNVARLAGEIYGVILNYWASLLNLRRHDLRWYEQASGVGFSLASMPFQWIPLLVAAGQKSAEGLRLAQYRRAWNGGRPVEAGLDLEEGLA